MNKPLIGVTMGISPLPGIDQRTKIVRVSNYYAMALEAAGGIGIHLPLATPALCAGLIPRLDGLILSGGGDIPAHVFNEPLHPASNPISMERWNSECLWLASAVNRSLPVLGICLGMQVMNVAAGGSIIQDIPELLPGAILHQTEGKDGLHPVRIQKSSKLYAWAGKKEYVETTSHHHQAIKEVGAPYRPVAWTEDGIIEAIENPEKSFMIGVQWHPERNPEQPDWVLQAFVVACSQRLPGPDKRI